MHERHAVALELLEDEAFAAEEARPQALGEGDADPRSLGRTEECVLLAQQGAAVPGHIDRENLARVRGGEGHTALAAAVVGEVRHKN